MSWSPFFQRGQFCFQGSCDRCYGRGFRCRRNLEEALGAMLEGAMIEVENFTSGNIRMDSNGQGFVSGDIFYDSSYVRNQNPWIWRQFSINLHPHRFYSATFPRISELVLALLRILLTACGKPQIFLKSGRTLLEFSDENGMFTHFSVYSLEIHSIYLEFSQSTPLDMLFKCFRGIRDWSCCQILAMFAWTLFIPQNIPSLGRFPEWTDLYFGGWTQTARGLGWWRWRWW